MNLALPVLILALALLPGIFFRLTLLHKVARRTTLNSAGGVLEDFAVALIPALLVHLVTASIIMLFKGAPFGLGTSTVLLPLLSGQFGTNAKLLTDIFPLLTPHTLLAYCAYTLITAGLGALAGKATLEIYILFGQDARLVPFAARPWYARLEQETMRRTKEYRRVANTPGNTSQVTATLSTVVDFKDQSYLFYGVVDDWYIDRSGQLERIELRVAERRALKDDKTAEMTDEKDQARYYDIEAEVVVLRAAGMKTMAIDRVTRASP